MALSEENVWHEDRGIGADPCSGQNEHAVANLLVATASVYCVLHTVAEKTDREILQELAMQADHAGVVLVLCIPDREGWFQSIPLF